MAKILPKGWSVYFFGILILLLVAYFLLIRNGKVNEGYCTQLGSSCTTDSECCAGSCKEKMNKKGKGTGKYRCASF